MNPSSKSTGAVALGPAAIAATTGPVAGQKLTRGLSMLVPVMLGSALLVVTAGASSAQGSVNDPVCGDTITVDTTLHADLVDCPSNGLVIGADDLTLNLNGHTIDGDAAWQE